MKGGVELLNKLEFYRRGLNITVMEMSELLRYSRQWYRRKEKQLDFSDKEKNKIIRYLRKKDKSITKEQIFS